MATTTAISAPAAQARSFLTRSVGPLFAIGVLAAIGLAVTIKFPEPSALTVALGIATATALAVTLFSERYAWSLAVLMLYLGLVDGYLKLSTGSSSVTAVRDILLYAIVMGALVRTAVRREELRLPPLTMWVVAWLVVVLIQLANPANGSLFHSLAALRQHLEWVPLFFLAYLVMRSKASIRGFLLLLLIIASINGIVGLAQLNLTPEQLAGWGPGYAEAISGKGKVSARVFETEKGEARTRPFALGGDFGFGGVAGMIAVPAALALLAIPGRRNLRILTAILAAGVVLAVVTSEARTAVVGSVIAALAFALLTVTSRAGLRTVIAIAVAGLVAYGTISYISSNTNKESFRYGSVSSPGKAVSTAIEYRSKTIAQVPKYATEFPLGAGFGSNGPASTISGGGSSNQKLNAESEPTFLLIEVGIPGVIVMFGFMFTLLYLSVTRIRRIADRETRVLLTGVAAPLFAIVSTWWVGVGTAVTPSAPYMWFAGGVIAFWLAKEIKAPRHFEALTHPAAEGPVPQA
jgi:hypothetical protein